MSNLEVKVLGQTITLRSDLESDKALQVTELAQKMIDLAIESSASSPQMANKMQSPHFVMLRALLELSHEYLKSKDSFKSFKTGLELRLSNLESDPFEAPKNSIEI